MIRKLGPRHHRSHFGYTASTPRSHLCNRPPGKFLDSLELRRTESAVPDALFAAAAGSGSGEMNVSKLGLERATDPELKQFSHRMIDEHTMMNQELVNLMAEEGIRVPLGIDARADCAGALGLCGEEFDKCYAKAQLVMHMDAVAAFEAEAHRGQNPNIKALAAKALPVIKEHLKTIKPIAMRYEKEKSEDRSAVRAGHERERSFVT